MEECGASYYIDETSNKCTLCSQSCNGCFFDSQSNSAKCLQCSEGFFMDQNGDCVSDCPTGQTAIDSYPNDVCMDCLSPCAECAGSVSECTACTDTNYLMDGKCISQCPDGFYPDVSSKVCLACSPLCKTCSSSTGCSVCKN